MVRVASRVLLATLSLALAGCRTETLDYLESPTVSVTPTPELGFGDGRDGPLTIGNTNRVVNDCRVLISGTGGTALVVESTAGLTSGTLVLALQVQEDLATSSGDPTAVGLSSAAGTWEIRRIEPTSDTVLTASSSWERTFVTSSTSRAQVCSVPEYTDVSWEAGSPSLITASKWNGLTGGVTAFFANGTVTLNAPGAIDAALAGFRGGALNPNDGTGSVTTFDPPLGLGAGKGESIDGRAWGLAGRGNYGNGGGGGNGLNAGGGGGGNGGGGGYGGVQFTVAGNEPLTAGLPGSRVDLPLPDRLTFGGGGGGGHQDNSQGTAGGAGGGIVLIFAHTLTGDGKIIAYAQKGGGVSTAGFDGAGGGGAGGTIVISTFGPSNFSGEVDANGRNGGDVDASVGERWGPGGGGGGGRILAATLTTSATITAAGGMPGTNTVPDPDDAWGATAGSAGVVNP